MRPRTIFALTLSLCVLSSLSSRAIYRPLVLPSAYAVAHNGLSPACQLPTQTTCTTPDRTVWQIVVSAAGMKAKSKP
jgi:hypothetical protein